MWGGRGEASGSQKRSVRNGHRADGWLPPFALSAGQARALCSCTCAHSRIPSLLPFLVVAKYLPSAMVVGACEVLKTRRRGAGVRWVWKLALCASVRRAKAR